MFDTQFYKDAEELGDLMDAIRLKRLEGRVSRFATAIAIPDIGEVFMSTGKSMGHAMIVAGASASELTDALKKFKQLQCPTTFEVHDECVPFGEDEWSRLERYTNINRIEVRSMGLLDELAVLAINASRKHGWLRWLFRPANALLEWGDSRTEMSVFEGNLDFAGLDDQIVSESADASTGQPCEPASSELANPHLPPDYADRIRWVEGE
jgi:hypothetical protein